MTKFLQRYHVPILIFLLTLLFRLIYIIFLSDVPPLKYLPFQLDLRAANHLTGTSMNMPDAWGSFPLILSGFYYGFKLLGLYSQRIQLFVLIQQLMSALSASLLYLVSKKLFRSRSIAIFTAATFALYYPLLYLSTMPLSETGFTLFLIAAFYFLIVPKKTQKSTLLSGLCFGLALISRPILASFTPFLFFWLLKFNRKTVFAGLSVIVFIAALLNARIDKRHRLSISSNTGANIALTQCRIRKLRYQQGDESFWFSPPAYWATGLTRVNLTVPFYQTSYYVKMAANCLLDQPQNLITNFTHLANIYHSKFYPDFNSTPLHRFLINSWKIPALLLTLAFLSFLFTKSSSKYYSLFLYLFLSLLISVYIASPGEERYLSGYFFILPLFGYPPIVRILTRQHLKQQRQRPQ